MRFTIRMRVATALIASGFLVAAGCGDSGSDTSHAPTNNPGKMESGGVTRGASSTGPTSNAGGGGGGASAGGAPSGGAGEGAGAGAGGSMPR